MSNIVIKPQASIRVSEGVLLGVLITEGYREEARVVTEPGVDVIVGHDE